MNEPNPYKTPLEKQFSIIFQNELRETSLKYNLGEISSTWSSPKHLKGLFGHDTVLDLEYYKGVNHAGIDLIYKGSVIFRSDNIETLKALKEKDLSGLHATKIKYKLEKLMSEHETNDRLAKFALFAIAKVFSYEEAVEVICRFLFVSNNHADALIGLTYLLRFESYEFDDNMLEILDTRLKHINKEMEDYYSNSGYSEFRYLIPFIFD